MQGPFIVSLDLGTSGCRAAAVTMQGKIACETRETLLPIRGTDGTSHYNAQTLLEVQQRVLDELLDQVMPAQVAGIAVASQRSTVVLWNARSAVAVAPVLTWEDGRAEQEVHQAAISQEDVHRLTGLYKTPYFSAPKIAWCLKNLPAAKEALEAGDLCVGPVATFFIWKLTHGATFATDASLAQRTLLFDIGINRWSSELCQAFGIAKTTLPDIRPSASDYGVYTYQGVDIPILSCVGDQQAAAYAMQLKPKQSCINYGTGAFWLYNAGQKPLFFPGMLTSVAAGSDAERNYFLEGPVNAAGSIFLWLQAQGISCEAEERQALCQTATNPVLLLPALGGLGAPYFDFSVTPAVANLSPRTRRSDWVAGAARGLAFLLTDIASYLREQGCELEGPVLASGGLAQLDYLVQFQADLLQLPLLVSTQTDATVLGAARLAAVRAGWNVSAWGTTSQQTFTSKIKPEEAANLYAEWKHFVTKCRAKS